MQPSDDSRSDESQASQLLRTVLRRDVVPDPRDTPLGHGSGGDSFPLQGSSSSTTSARSQRPHYHFHGLAATQTESQVEGQHDGEGSQKENSPASWERSRGAPSSPIPSSSPPPVKIHNECPDASGRKVSHSPTQPPRTAVPMQVSRPVTQNTSSGAPLINPSLLGTNGHKAVSFVSPVASPRGAPPVRPLTRGRRQRSPSPASEDSFAGPLPFEDPAKAFVRNTKIFNMPLSEFGKDETTDETSSALASSSRTSTMWGNTPYNRVVPPSSPPGEILVAGTPSDPSQSQDARTPSQSERVAQTQRSDNSQLDGNTQTSDVFAQGQVQDSDVDFENYCVPTPVGVDDAGGISSSPDKSTQPSPSYQDLLNQDPYAPDPETDIATQIATQVDDEPTQLSDSAVNTTNEAGPSAGVDNYHAPFGDFAFGQLRIPSVARTTTSTNTTAMTAPRGLAAIVHPNKRWRYGLADSPQEGGGDRNDATGLTIPGFLVQDTQPSDVAVHGSVLPEILDTQLPSPPPPRRRQLRAPRSAADVANSGAVPDSEDARHAARIPSPPLAPGSATPRRAGKAKQGHLEVEEDIEEDIIPESMDVDHGQSESDDDEDDVPFAAVVQTTRRQKKKAKTPAAERARKDPKASNSRSKDAAAEGPKDSLVIAKKATGRGRAQAATKSGDGPARQGRSWETDVIPSSNPRQDSAGAAAAPAVPSGRTTTRKKKAPSVSVETNINTRSKSRSMTPAIVKRSRPLAVEESSEGETAVSKDAEATIPDSDEEQTTELADNDQMDVDQEDDTPSVSEPVQKRKRSTRKTATKASTRSAKSAPAATPMVRSSKKLKTSSVLKSGPSTATRVFALWKGDGLYYSGTVHSLVSAVPARYLIHFDDESEDTVDISKMRLCQLRVGDYVLNIGDKVAGKVVECGDCGPDDQVSLEIDNGEELDRIDTEVQRIRIASRTLQSEWTDRTLSVETIWPIVRPKLMMNSPSSSKSTMASGGSIKGSRKFLAKTGFVVTLSPGNENWEQDKDRLMLIIKNNGGIVLHDWTNVFTMEGCHSESNKRWVAHKQDINFIGREDIECVYLLSDAANRKPKFLVALALGIPCVSIEWLEQIAAERCGKDWQPFLLPAGFCDQLDARVSQLVDMDWGNSLHHVTDIMSNKVAPKLFLNQTVLCVGSEFVPLPPKAAKRTTDAEKAKEASRMVPRIILAMGAARVEAVADVKYASEADLTRFDYVVVKEQVDVARFAAKAVNCVDLGWVKQCLIASRLLPRMIED